MWQSLSAPHCLFVLFACLEAAVLIALIPPLAGGNETNNFRRVAAISAGHVLVEPASVPRGVADLLDLADAQNPERTKLPPPYSTAEFRALAAVPLRADVRATLLPNPIAVLNPVAYVPQVLAYWFGEVLGWTPLTLFYLGRIAGAAAGIALTAAAIRRMPCSRYGLAALALLPTIVFSRSTLDADQVTNGLAFLFAAMFFAAIVARERMSAGSLAVLAGTAFLMAQCKSAYLVLLLLALAIPAERFASRRAWFMAMALIILPGTLADVAWIAALKHTYFAGIRYRTYAGIVVPDAQIAHILRSPLSFVHVLLRTLFAPSFVSASLLGFLGVFGPPVEMPVICYILLLTALTLVLVGEGRQDGPKMSSLMRLLALGSFAAGVVLILTLLYVQWDGVGAQVIRGFQGRYLYPLAAPLLALLPGRRPVTYFGLDTASWTTVLASISLLGTALVTWTTYWG